MICDVCKEGAGKKKSDTKCSLCGDKYFHMHGMVCGYTPEGSGTMPIHIDVCDICYEIAANDEVVRLFKEKHKEIPRGDSLRA